MPDAHIIYYCFKAAVVLSSCTLFLSSHSNKNYVKLVVLD